MTKKRLLTRRNLVLLALALLLAWSAWYVRPMNFYGLASDFTPEIIDVTVMRLGEPWSNSKTRHLRLEAGEPGFDALLKKLEGLRFHRYPTNPLLLAIPALQNVRVGSTIIEDYDYHLNIALAAFDSEVWDAELTFWIDQWSCRNYGRGVSLPMYLFDGHNIGKALGDELWELAPEEDSTEQISGQTDSNL